MPLCLFPQQHGQSRFTQLSKRILAVGYGYGYDGSTFVRFFVCHTIVLMQLSPRELQIVTLLQQGISNKEIGLALGLSPHTVRDHISVMFQRFGVGGRAALAAMCRQKLQEPLVIQGNMDRRVGTERRTPSRSPASTPQDTPSTLPL